MTVFFREWRTRAGLPSGGWYWRFMVDGVESYERAKNPDNPKQKAKTEKEAKYFESIAFARTIQGEEIFKPKKAPWTFERFVEEKYRAVAKQNHRHYEDGVRYCLTVLLPSFGSTLISQITPFDIETFKQSQMARESKRSKTGEKIKNKTINNYLDCLSGIFTSAIAEGMREDNPVDSVMRLEVEEIEKRVLSHEEEARLLMACDSLIPPDRDYVKAAIVILVEGGFRPQEFFGKTRGGKKFLGMKKSDVDLENRRVTVISYKNGRGKRRKPAQPKKRRVPISNRALPCFELLMRTPGEKLYPNFSVKKAWATICEKARVENFWLRWLRDTFKHRCELAGFGPFEIALMMGHASPTMTMDYSVIEHGRALGLMARAAAGQQEKRESEALSL